MTKVDAVKKVARDLETNPHEALSSLTKDFKFSGAVPEPINGPDWIQVHEALKKAFPDIKINLQEVREENGKVYGTVSLTGTHKAELNIPDLPSVPPTGKHFQLPKEPVTIRFEGDKLSEWKVQRVPGGGVPGIYKQLGVPLPSRVPA